MSRIDLIRSAVDKQLSDPYNLLAMRLMFPPDRVEVEIGEELKDLYTYPERLHTGYHDEWRSLAVRALFDNAFSDHWRSDQENLDRYIEFLLKQAIPRCIHDNIGLFRTLGEVLAIARSDNTIRFPDPKRRALMDIIWPDDSGL